MPWRKRGIKGRCGVGKEVGAKGKKGRVQKEKGKQSCKKRVASATRFATLAPPEPRPPKPARRSDPGTRGRYEAGLEAWGSHAGLRPESFTVKKQHEREAHRRQKQKRARLRTVELRTDTR